MIYSSLICDQPESFLYRQDQLELTPPSANTPTALLKVKQVGICGTDLHAFDGTQPFFQYPRILGHEICAEIVELPPTTPNPDKFQAGDLVTLIPYFSCGSCIACRSHKPNCCSSIQVFGVHIDGGLRQFIQVPFSALVKGPGLNPDQLALVEPLAIGAHAVRRANLQAGESILVIGAGPIGLGLMEMARIAGAAVIAMDVNTSRLEFCQQQLGIQHTINPKEEDAVEAIKNITKGDMATAVFDATGNLNAIEGGLQFLAHGGRFVLVGLQKQSFSFSHPEFHKRESTLMSSRNATREDFNWVISSLQSNLIQPANYITHRIAFSQLAELFKSLSNPSNGVIKAMVDMEA
ncbi:zinc-binding alcohol dehydrogenase family protein [Flavihumibacter sp. RY-1]|uniref:Zinc-binding alcohol dehydrogenase family protein n=1 Tax=Flavihumibacter fluminis TaxID=2909236 RepID=A0ABS9BMA2_9BACT|nr:zinc-binding alcohol dehydrogenase family protein [Flavihumibacter fluminis]MCF1716856.1 zinc-binding alcohol dehydrogenase family protein [Flavihumibacter fluminis]